MHLLRLSGHMYILSKKLAKVDQEIHSYHSKIERYTHKYQVTNDSRDKQKLHQKLEKLSQEYKKLRHERHGLLRELHSFCAGFARGLQSEAQIKN